MTRSVKTDSNCRCDLRLKAYHPWPNPARNQTSGIRIAGLPQRGTDIVDFAF
jgi:hypothetical protein